MIPLQSLWRLVFYVMMLTYAGFSTPTPEEIGPAEIIVGALLVLLVGIKGLSILVNLRNRRPSTVQVAPLYIVGSVWCVLLVPSFVGLVFRENSGADYIRDVIPLLYLLAPVFLLPRMVAQPLEWIRAIIIGMVLVGVLFSYRHFQVAETSMLQVGRGVISVGNDYFPMEPAVLFAATFLICRGLLYIFLVGKVGLLKGVLSCLGGAIPMFAIIAVVLRAQIALVGVSVVIILMYTLRTRPLRATIIMLFFIAMVGIYEGEKVLEFGAGVWDILAKKQEAVGFSGRDLELQAVLDNMDSLDKALFGEGWGGLIGNPIGGGAKWRYVHNSIAYFLFKTGLVGTILIGVYGYWIAKQGIVAWKGWHGVWKVPVFLAAGSVFFVHTLLETGYKMLTFGIIVLLVVLLPRGLRAVSKDRVLDPLQEGVLRLWSNRRIQRRFGRST